MSAARLTLFGRLRPLRVGLGVSRESIRAVALRGQAIAWAMERPIADGETPGAALSALLGGAPLPAWPRALVLAALGPSLAQTRRLGNLPPVPNARLRDALVRENAGRFFLRNGAPLATSAVDEDGKGGMWAAACDAPVLADLERACRGRHVRLAKAAPAVVMLGAVTPNGCVRWHDGDSCLDVEFVGGRMTTLRRVAENDPAASPADPCVMAPATPQVHPTLAMLGTDAWRFADAFAAACSTGRVPLSWTLNGAGNPEGSVGTAPVSRVRARIAVAAMALAVLAALAAPGLGAMRAERLARQRLTALSTQRAAALRDAGRLVQVSAALNEYSAFIARGQSPTLFLGELARLLPTGAAALSVQTDSAGGTVVVLAPSAAAVLAGMERIPGVASPEMVGPVTREMAGSRGVERVTVAWKWAATPGERCRTPAGGARCE